MSLKDKLEIGLKPDAPYRPDNLPEHQQNDPDCQKGSEPGDGPRQREARERCDDKTKKSSESDTRERKQDEAAEARFVAEGGPVK
jgi:hypothetical protein